LYRFRFHSQSKQKDYSNLFAFLIFGYI